MNNARGPYAARKTPRVNSNVGAAAHDLHTLCKQSKAADRLEKRVGIPHYQHDGKLKLSTSVMSIQYWKQYCEAIRSSNAASLERDVHVRAGRRGAVGSVGSRG